MLKELVRRRLIEAADEIFRLFESTILSYEEQLYQAKRENEQQRQQLEAVGNTQTVLRVQDALQTADQSGHQKELPPELGTPNWDKHPQPCSVKEELQPLHVEDTQVFHTKEEIVGDMPLTGLPAQSKNEELSQVHPQNPSGDHSVNPPPNNRLAPSSNRVDTASWSSNKDSECHEKRTVLYPADVLQTANQSGHHKELPPKSELGTSNSQPCGVKEELQPLHVEDTQVFHIKEENVGDMPLTGLPAQSTNEELSQVHPQNPSGDHSINPPLNNLLGPSSNRVDIASWSSNKDSEGYEKRTLLKRQKHLTCSDCGERFGRRPDLLYHKNTCRSPFSCSLCGKVFPMKSNLVEHMKNHYGDKPFKCSTCSKTFTQKYSLKRHMRMHTGEQPFVCTFCGKKFAYQPTLFRHLRNHTGEKPFKCPTCGTTFTQKSILHEHKKTCFFVSESWDLAHGLKFS
ncbi:uncharacterized protein LOC144086001 [Stigmatopora argus]